MKKLLAFLFILVFSTAVFAQEYFFAAYGGIGLVNGPENVKTEKNSGDKDDPLSINLSALAGGIICYGADFTFFEAKYKNNSYSRNASGKFSIFDVELGFSPYLDFYDWGERFYLTLGAGAYNCDFKSSRESANFFGLSASLTCGTCFQFDEAWMFGIEYKLHALIGSGWYNSVALTAGYYIPIY